MNFTPREELYICSRVIWFQVCKTFSYASAKHVGMGAHEQLEQGVGMYSLMLGGGGCPNSDLGAMAFLIVMSGLATT